MPIVSLLPMAMNESICATCCYKIITSPSNYYWEVLNGGWLGERPDDYPAWRADVDANWAEFPFDVDFSAHAGMTAMPFFHREKNAWWVQYHVSDDSVLEISLDEFLSGGIAQMVNADCAHVDDSQCLYLAVGVPPPYREHIDSTRPHTTAPGVFRSPHRALQYTS